MPNFNKTEFELETKLDKWLYFIKNLETFQSLPKIFKHELVFIEAIEKEALSKMNEEAQKAYQVRLKSYCDNNAQKRIARSEELEKRVKKGIALRLEKEKQISKNIY